MKTLQNKAVFLSFFLQAVQKSNHLGVFFDKITSIILVEIESGKLLLLHFEKMTSKFVCLTQCNFLYVFIESVAYIFQKRLVMLLNKLKILTSLICRCL